MPKGKNHPPGALDDDIDLWSDGSETPTPAPAPRRSTRMSSQPAKKDPVDPLSKVNNEETTLAFLRKEGFLTNDHTILTTPAAALILLQITKWAKISQTGTDAIRAVAFLMEAQETQNAANTITEKITAAIIPQIEAVKVSNHKPQPSDDHTETNRNQPQTTANIDLANMSATINKIHSKVEHTHEILTTAAHAVCTTDSNIEYLMSRFEKIYPDNLIKNPDPIPDPNNAVLKTVQSTLEELKNRLPPANLLRSEPARTRPLSYATAVATSNLTRTQREIIARSEARGRQVAVRCTTNSTKDLSEKDLATMVTSALHSPTDSNNSPLYYCRSVRKTKNDIILLEMNSKEAAKWLSKHDNRTHFTEHFNIDSQILEPTFKTRVDFVPVTLQVNDSLSLRDIEEMSNLPAKTISQITWMRRPASRKPQQKVAHAFITFNDPAAANFAIREGLTIEGKKVNAQRTYPEPMRCFKCQGYQQHLISDCPATEDTCGTCGKHDHRTPQCTETTADHFYCSNCKQHGHASWDRNCPTFTREAERLKLQHPERGCKYFTIEDDLSTWPDPETPKPPITPQPPTQNQTPNPHPPPTLQTQPCTHHDDGWQTTQRRNKRNAPSTTKEPPRNRDNQKARNPNANILTNPTGTQTNLDGFVNRSSQRQSTPDYRRPPEPLQLSPPSPHSPSRPISDDLYLIPHNL